MLVLILPFPNLNAQLFPGLEGDELVTAIQNDYTPFLILTDAQVKDTLYARVFIETDSIHCIYSNLGHSLPAGVDPSQWIYENGSGVNSMNLEHGWPQAKGASSDKPGNRDMHHLFPSRSAINSDRGDSPYQEIQDQATQKWYYLDLVTGTPPANNRDLFSEYKSGAFEPRESFKGDIARAMFYFWTIYRDDAIEADPLFFDLMRDNLCLWQEADPVDTFEMVRTQRIATYQDGKPNPFILDCSLAQRTYCPNIPACEMVAVEPVFNPSGSITVNGVDRTLKVESTLECNWQLILFDLSGKNIYDGIVYTNQNINLSPAINGIFFAIALHGGDRIFSGQMFLFP